MLGLLFLFDSILFSEEKATISIVIGLLIGLGISAIGSIALNRMLGDKIKVMRDTHPLLNAIKNGHKDYLVWVYIEQINTKIGNDGPT
ncbi:MAG: hypothetical protein ACPG4Z_07420, partial [Chitinophagales bacterium]